MKAFYEAPSAPEMTWLVLKAPHMSADDVIGAKFSRDEALAITRMLCLVTALGCTWCAGGALEGLLRGPIGT